MRNSAKSLISPKSAIPLMRRLMSIHQGWQREPEQTLDNAGVNSSGVAA